MIEFRQYIPSFATLLEKITITDITADAYAASYLSNLLQHKEYYLNIYSLALERAFAESNKSPEKTSLIDFGCGNGLLAIFAKYCGVGKVYAADFNPIFLSSAQKIAAKLNIKIDGMIEGDENALMPFFSGKEVPDMLIATDVIEHVYDLNNLFAVLQQLNPLLISAFTTASVAENPFQSYKLKKLQQRDELTDSNSFHGSKKEGFAGMAYLQSRKKIIKDKYHLLSEETIALLAKTTRGLIEKDIYKTVDLFIKDSIKPQELSHPTNTCDPFTGSWTERLLTIDEYKVIYERSGFTLKVYNGFYNGFEQTTKSELLKLLNRIIVLLGVNGKTIAPFIVLVGKPQ